MAVRAVVPALSLTCPGRVTLSQAQKAGGAGPSMVPYRDSKLTRIFQSYFCGGLGSRVTMIVNVSPSPVVFDETIQVLKFSALAKQVSSGAGSGRGGLLQERRPTASSASAAHSEKRRTADGLPSLCERLPQLSLP